MSGESCLVIHPASRNEGTRQDSGMGINSTSRSEVDSFRNSDRSSQTSSVSMKRSEPPRQLTDESDTSNPDEKDTPKSMEVSKTENEKARETSKRKACTLKRAGPGLEEAASSDQASTPGNVSMPQHEQLQPVKPVEPLDIYYSSTAASLKLKSVLVSRLSEVATSGRIQVVDMSRRGIGVDEAELICRVLKHNQQLAVLKLGDNNLGDKGAAIIASSCKGRPHQGLTILDLGFNSIGDSGVMELSLNMIAGNHILRNLYLAGNKFKKEGALAIAGAIMHGCSLARLQLSSNKLGKTGMKVLARAIAEMDARRTHLLQRSGGIVVAAIKPPAVEELHLADASLRYQGLIPLTSMLVSNSSLQLLNLSNNEIGDKEMALMSQALAQNKSVPLSQIYLSFNKITCAGVECFMNAVWGSQTLKEIKLDNNKIQDRGAQLCSVVLGSIRLEVLDISFNRVSTVGIKAVMKSLSENDSLRVLSLSGIPMDQNASKAVSYALAYNTSLEVFNVDSCCVGYSGQRHIVAGIVSNRKVKLRKVTGFSLGGITKTLGLPMVPEDWPNDRILSFVRYMWSHWRSRAEDGRRLEESRGPAPPASVAASGKEAFAALSASQAAKLEFMQEHQSPVEESPLISPDAAILVRSDTGQNLQVPQWDDNLEADEDDNDSWSSEADSFDRSSYSGSEVESQKATEANTERRNKNLQWLRAHFQSLTEVGNLSFNNADLWQLHQYFFSPAYSTTDEGETEDEKKKEMKEVNFSNVSTPKAHRRSKSKMKGMGRTESFKALGKAVEEAVTAKSSEALDASRPNKRGSLEQELKGSEPCAKRAKNFKPRIAYFPRIREKLESLGTKPSAQTLSLLRQLKYIESVMLEGKDIYNDEKKSSEGPSASDVEMILLDLL